MLCFVSLGAYILAPLIMLRLMMFVLVFTMPSCERPGEEVCSA